MKRRIHIYQQDLVSELRLVFDQLSDHIHVEHQDDNTLILLDEDFYNEEPLDLEEFYMLLVDDFDRDVTIFIEPYTDEDFPLSTTLSSFLPSLPHNVYYFDDMITYSVLQANQEVKTAVKNYISSRVNADVIHTVREFIDNNMNSSVSAKKLYMHRNTLNYRIENFIEATHINVKTFRGANAIYMLYKY